MFRLRRPSPEECSRLLAGFAGCDLSYPEVGATEHSQLPSGYRHDRYRETIGDATRFDSAAGQVLNWAAQLGAGVAVSPSDRGVNGSNHVLCVKLGLLWAVAPVRVVYVVDKPDRAGFAYGTLPGHPEVGEEAFIVERHDDRTDFEIVAFSRPAHWLVRLGAPVSRAVQTATTRRYIRALQLNP
jgi:uncharacterized protein (UPF0548 family)